MRIPSSSASTAIRAPARCRHSCISCFSARSSSPRLKQHDLFAPLRVADYLIDKDRLFARTTLDEEEYRSIRAGIRQTGNRSPQARSGDLSAGTGRCAARRASAGAASQHEQFIDRGYLERLNDAYARFFHEYDAGPLLIVNAAAIDPVDTAEDYEELLAAIRRLRRGRLYYNPMRHAAL